MSSSEIFLGIISDSGILGGEAVIKGTRVPVSLILGHLVGGMSKEELRACLKIETGTISSSEKRGKIDKELQRIPSCRDDCVRTLGSDYRQQEAVCFSKASFL